MSIKLQVPKPSDLRPRITVIGVGGAGGNAVNNMITAGLQGVDFIVANTDAQALVASKAPSRIQLGTHLTEGLGAGSKPEVGEAAAIEAEEELKARISGTHMLFIAAGMGGGTGTGAAAVIGKVARELGILTIAVVTKPFQFEGTRRMRTAEAGIAELKKFVDTLIVIPNQNLFRVANERTTFAEAFVLADQVLYSGIACIVDLIVKDGLINLDLADVRTILAGMGPAVMGTGEGEGERRAAIAAEEAITNQLLDNMSLKGAKGLLLSIIGGPSLTLFDIDEAATRVRQEIDPEANVIVGAAFDESLGDRVRVSIVASGMPDHQPAAPVSTARPPRSAVESSVVREPDTVQSAPQVPLLQPASRVAPPPLPGAFAMPPPPEQPVPTAAVPENETWFSPDQVQVTERPTVQIVDHSTPVRPAAVRTAGESVYAQPVDGFVPQAPVEVKKSVSRVPEVAEFPAIGQKDYWSKKGHTPDSVPVTPPATASAVSSPPEQRKGSLFQRLADAARGKGRSGERTAKVADQDQLPPFFGDERRRG
jgi:cell division protein FtsZ